MSPAASTGLLEQLGYTVRWVPNAEAALHEIERDGIDIVFSDIVMPGSMDGLGLARAIQAEIRPCRSCSPPATAKPRRSVRDDFPILRKPYQIHELSGAIAKLPR